MIVSEVDTMLNNVPLLQNFNLFSAITRLPESIFMSLFYYANFFLVPNLICINSQAVIAVTLETEIHILPKLVLEICK